MSDCGETPESQFSELCMNLEDTFFDLPEINKMEAGMSVYARIRPMLQYEKEAGYKECIGLTDDKVVRAIFPASSSKYKTSSRLSQDMIEDFTFTTAYGPESGQLAFFADCMMDTMQNFIEGQNSLVFSYGTTGSGKTFTLQGNPDEPGIIPLSLHLFFASVENQLFDRIFAKPDKFADVVALNDNEVKRELEIKEQLLSSCNEEEWGCRNSTSTKSLAMMLCDTFSDKFGGEELPASLGPDEIAQAQAAALMKNMSKQSGGKQSGYCSVWVSFIEIYNENVYDLLQSDANQRTKLNLGEDKNGDVYVKGLREVCVSNTYEALKLLDIGQRNLRIAPTKLNYQSSRSHCIFTIKVIRFPETNNMTYAKVHRLSFCDLAGSERAAKSQTTGVRLKEAACINTSLLVFGRCLEQLRLKLSLRDKKRIPFRESKLTRLFSGFFTGNGKAVMITNVSPSELSFDETLHVLRFSAIAKQLIINDSYLATASSTLQSITNLWNNARNNSANASTSSDKSISFESSIESEDLEDVLLQKDELIEKLLDLAESLKNNLQHEKKERAELEVKMRQEIGEEYTEYSDEIFEYQKQAFEEEQETIKEIYERRISSMEEMYDKAINGYKSQLEDLESSEDEFTITAVQKMDSQVVTRNTRANETSLEVNVSEIGECSQYSNKSIESEYMAALEENADSSLHLEAEVESMAKKLEDTQHLLESALKENETIKKELDTYKIDCYAYKIDNENLLKKKSEVETDIKALAEDLATLSQEKAVILQELEESKCNVRCQSDEIQSLLKRIDDLMRDQNESSLENKRLLEEADTKAKHVSEKLVSVSNELEEERNRRKALEVHKIEMEEEISKLQNFEKCTMESENAVVTLSKQTEELQNRNEFLEKELETVLNSEKKYCQSVSKLQKIIEELNSKESAHCKDVRELSDSVKQHESELDKNRIAELEKALEKTKDLTERLDNLQNENQAYKDEIERVKKSMEDKLSSASKQIEIEKNRCSQLEVALEETKEKNGVFGSLLSSLEIYKRETCELKKINLNLREKLNSAHKDLERNKNRISNVENDLTKSLEGLKSENQAYKKEIEILKRAIEDKPSTASKELESQKLISIEKKQALMNELNEANIIIKAQQKEQQSLINKLNEAHKIMSAQTDQLCENQKTLINKVKKANEIVNAETDMLYILTCENKENKSIINELKKLNEDLKEKINSLTFENESKIRILEEELDTLHKKLSDSDLKVKEKSDELEILSNRSKSDEDKIKDLQNNIETMAKKMSSLVTQSSITTELVEVLERCESRSSDKIKVLMGSLKLQKKDLENRTAEHEKKCTDLLGLVHLLENCEVFATERTKRLHTSVLNHVEQIMDLNKHIKNKEKINEDLNNDCSALHKRLKDLQASSRKQLQEEKEKLKTSVHDMEMKLADAERSNETLNYELSELKANMDKLVVENENLKLSQRINKEENDLRETKQKQKVSSALKELNISDRKTPEKKAKNKAEEDPSLGEKTQKRKQSSELKELNTSEKKTPERKVTNKAEEHGSVEEKPQKRKTSNSLKELNASDRKTPERKAAIKVKESNTPDEETPERKATNETLSQKSARKNKQATEKPKNFQENKKQKTQIYEETNENGNNDDTTKERRSRKKTTQLRYLPNCFEEQDLIIRKKHSSLSKTNVSKRKEREDGNQFIEKKSLKKLRFQDMNSENISKPENLRVRLLKTAVTPNAIALPSPRKAAPSPRMTRNRKRLVLEKENLPI